MRQRPRPARCGKTAVLDAPAGTIARDLILTALDSPEFMAALLTVAGWGHHRRRAVPGSPRSVAAAPSGDPPARPAAPPEDQVKIKVKTTQPAYGLTAPRSQTVTNRKTA